MILEILFYIFAAIALASGVMVIVSRNPVHGALFLVFTFVMCAGIWLLLQAEFLALVLILVYVGAVMTLFLFVVMMLNLDQLPPRDALKRYLPLAVILVLLIVGIVAGAVSPEHFALDNVIPLLYGAGHSDVKILGGQLYTHYVYAFEVAAVILLAAIIAAIALAFRGRQPGTKSQKINQQIKTRRDDAVRLVDMSSEQKS